MLTPKQQKLLEFLTTSLEQNGVCPSYDEMREALNLKSKSGIHRLLTSLQERGFIRRLAHRARAIEIRRRATEASRLSTESVPATTQANPALGLGAAQNSTQAVPLLGKIAAGTPIEALRDDSTLALVPQSMIGQGDHFALKVEGESMRDLGIMDGDLTIIRRTDRAANGRVVVALIDEQEATLKTLHAADEKITLKAANPDYPDYVYESGQVRIQGELVGLLRHY
ncbi:MAG: transcriptional repressor LexA [Pseudomonadota bacterium]